MASKYVWFQFLYIILSLYVYIMRSAKSYIKDTGVFLNKLKELGRVP